MCDVHFGRYSHAMQDAVVPNAHQSRYGRADDPRAGMDCRVVSYLRIVLYGAMAFDGYIITNDSLAYARKRPYKASKSQRRTDYGCRVRDALSGFPIIIQCLKYQIDLRLRLGHANDERIGFLEVPQNFDVLSTNQFALLRFRVGVDKHNVDTHCDTLKRDLLGYIART